MPTKKQVEAWEKMSLEEIEAEREALMQTRDGILEELHALVAVRNQKQAIATAEAKLNNMSEQERTAMAHIIGAGSIVNGARVGTPHKD